MIPPHIASLKKDDFYLPTMEVLRDLGGSGSIEEIEEKLIDRFGFVQADLDAVYPTSGDPIVTDKMSWARSYLKFPGFVANDSRGVWVLSEAGRGAIELPLDAVRREIGQAKAKRRAEQLKAKASSAAADALDDGGEEGQDGPILDWRDELLAVLRAMDPAAFERLCQRLLRESGFVKVEVTGKSGDGGIDGVGVLRMNLISFQVLFQCKRYAGAVSSPTVRDFRGAMQGRADKGLIITTGSFTADARREATRDGAPAIDLVDGDTLCDLLRERRLGVETREIVTHEIVVRPAFFEDL